MQKFIEFLSSAFRAFSVMWWATIAVAALGTFGVIILNLLIMGGPALWLLAFTATCFATGLALYGSN